MAGEPALPPDVGLLGDDRAVAIEVVLKPRNLTAEVVDAGVAAGGRGLAVRSLERRRERTKHPAKLVTIRGGREAAEEHASQGDRGQREDRRD